MKNASKEVLSLMPTDAKHNRAPHRADIVAAIHRRDKKVSAIAQDAGISPGRVLAALDHNRSVTGDIVIADFLEIDPRILWPDRWAGPKITPKRELWLLKNAEKLALWAGNRLEDVGR